VGAIYGGHYGGVIPPGFLGLFASFVFPQEGGEKPRGGIWGGLLKKAQCCSPFSNTNFSRFWENIREGTNFFPPEEVGG